jgi:MFS family permease
LTLLPEFPFLVTVWLGPTIADAVLRSSSWRWGYGMWAIILPAAFLPLALSLLLNQRKAQRLNLIKSSRRKRKQSFFGVVKRTWYDLDVGGLTLLSAAVTLILVPLTLAANSKNGWGNANIIVMMVVGIVCLCVLPFWEGSKRMAPKPLLSLHLLRQRTPLAGCALAFWYFSTCLP